MRNFFNMDSPVFRFLSRVADLMVLNIVFLVCCIPIITIGASVTSMCYVALKMKDDEGYVVRSFFKSFKQNFKQSTLIWLLLLFLAVILGLDLFILRAMEGTFAKVMYVMVYMGGILWLMIFLYVFPLQARFYNTIRGTLRNAVLLAVINLPRTICMIAVTVASVAVTFLNGTTFVYGILIWIMLGFAAVCYINMTLLYKVIRKLIDEQEAKETEEVAELFDK